jgi:hypothetical protein
MPIHKMIARFITAFEPFILIGTVILFWFPSNFPFPSDGVTGISTDEWLWMVTGAFPFFIAYWVSQTDVWRGSPAWLKWVCGVGLVVGYGLIYIHLPFLPIPSYAVDRADWFWLIGLLVIFIPIRWLAYGVYWRVSWVEACAGALMIIAVINVAVAPNITGYIIRGQGWAGLGLILRPLLGILLMGYLIEMGRRQGRLDGVIQILLGVTAILTLIALAGTQWTVKSELFTDFIFGMGDYLPDSRPFFRRNSINPNEIGGALAWLVPFCAVAIFYPWHRDRWAWRIITMMIFVASALAMILGQSRFGLLGVLGALTIAFILLFPNWRLRLLLFTVITMVGILQAGVLLNLFTDDGGVGLSERDERSASQRLAIWSSAWAMIEDYPLTGVGLNNFRFTPVRNRYPIIGYDYLKPPHAHNELLQIGADMGLAGMAVFIGLHGAMLIYLWISYQRGIHPSQIVAVAVGAGILAHIGYSIGDAIPIWDRLHFVFWTMLGVGMAGYHLRRPIDISNP